MYIASFLYIYIASNIFAYLQFVSQKGAHNWICRAKTENYSML